MLSVFILSIKLRAIILSIILISAIPLSVVMASIIRLSVIMLSVFMLNVVAPIISLIDSARGHLPKICLKANVFHYYQLFSTTAIKWTSLS
jgi:hypothetical protein